MQVTPGPHSAGNSHQQVFPSDTGSHLPEHEPLLLRAKDAERQENLRHKKELIRSQRAQRITSTRRKTRSLARALLCSGDSDLESGGEEVDITKFLPPLFTASKKMKDVVWVSTIEKGERVADRQKEKRQRHI